MLAVKPSVTDDCSCLQQICRFLLIGQDEVKKCQAAVSLSSIPQQTGVGEKLGMAPRGKVITPSSHMVGGYNPTPSLDVCRWCVGACALHEQFGTKLVSMV